MKINWHSGEVPKHLKVTQVYGLVFSLDGRMLLRVFKSNSKIKFSLAGGTPEQFDRDREATLRRELLEEVNTKIQQETFVVGYQEIDEENGNAPYAQLRMTALIDEIGPQQPDPDNGETYGRYLAPPQRAIELLNWGDVGRLQIEEAARIAEEKLGITNFSQKEEDLDAFLQK